MEFSGSGLKASLVERPDHKRPRGEPAAKKWPQWYCCMKCHQPFKRYSEDVAACQRCAGEPIPNRLDAKSMKGDITIPKPKYSPAEEAKMIEEKINYVGHLLESGKPSPADRKRLAAELKRLEGNRKRFGPADEVPGGAAVKVRGKPAAKPAPQEGGSWVGVKASAPRSRGGVAPGED